MTIKFNNVYIKDGSTVVGPYEAEGPFKKYYDKKYKDLSFGCDSWEKSEIKMIKSSINILLRKIKNNKVDLLISSDLTNQLVASNYASVNYNIPYMGVYSACASSVLELFIGSVLIENKYIKNAIVTSSSHNNNAEKQYRNPVEYGGPKKCYTTFTTTGCGSIYMTCDRTNIKVDSVTIGTTIDKGITDISNMGAVMAPAAADTLYKHLCDTKRDISYYDLILTGDLGKVGRNILKDYMNEVYNINLINYNDSACMIFKDDKKYYQGGSGVACLPLVTISYIFRMLKKKKLKRVLLIATGALMNTTMCNEKLSIPSISHAISLEAL